jgi:hypothetical protein
MPEQNHPVEFVVHALGPPPLSGMRLGRPALLG